MPTNKLVALRTHSKTSIKDIEAIDKYYEITEVLARAPLGLKLYQKKGLQINVY